MHGQIVRRTPSTFVGLRVVDTFEALPDRIPEVRIELLQRQFEIEGILDADVLLGVSVPHDPVPSDDHVATHIGFETSTNSRPPTGMTRLDLAGGDYAQFTWHGSFDAEEFEGFYPGIFDWFQANAKAPSDRSPWIEVYGVDNDWEDRSSSSNQLTVYMPLAPGVAR